MTDRILIVWQLLMLLKPWHGDDETPDQREIRMGVLATAIVIATEGNTEREIALIVQGKSDSNLALHVHQGRCGEHEASPKHECDAEWRMIDGHRVRVFLARGVFQSQRPKAVTLAAMWDRALGADLAATVNSARLADHLLRTRRCGGDLVSMYTAQGGGGCRESLLGKKRSDLHVWLRAKRVEIVRINKGTK